MAAPADPHTTDRQAAALPAGALRAWCPNCLVAARRIAKQQTNLPTTDQCVLFDL